jgi:uncharacterized membrane protein
MNKWKIIAGIVLIFLFGALAGGVTTHIFYRKAIHGVLTGQPDRFLEIIVKRLEKRLDLDGTQREQLRAIVKETQQEILALRKEMLPKIEGIVDNSHGKVRKILRPEQQEAFKKLVEERKARFFRK